MPAPAAVREEAAPPSEAPVKEKAEAPMASLATAGGGAPLPPNLLPEQIAVIDSLILSRDQLVAQLVKLLETAPESMKPLLAQAIRGLDAGYRSAITNWAQPRQEN